MESKIIKWLADKFSMYEEEAVIFFCLCVAIVIVISLICFVIRIGIA